MYPNRIIAIDLETTGLIPAYDYPTSFDAWVFEDGEPTGEGLSLKIRPDNKLKLSMEAFFVQKGDTDCLDSEAFMAQVQRIFPQDAISRLEAMKQIAEWGHLVNAPYTPNVAQKSSFDMGFYDEKLSCYTSAYKTSPLSPVWICTKTMASVAMPDCKRPGLQTLATVLGIEHDAKSCHESKYDALLCGRVYFALKKLLESA